MNKQNNLQTIDLKGRTEDRQLLGLIGEIPRVHVFRDQAALDLYLTKETPINALLNWLTQCRWSIFHELNDGQKRIIINQNEAGGLSCKKINDGLHGDTYLLRLHLIGLPPEDGRRIPMEEKFRLILTTPTGLSRTFHNRPSTTPTREKGRKSSGSVHDQLSQMKLRVVK
ncbi:hypothetical protein A2480_02640 [Candidatus Uhrbacteria bacterium RIFOXYC2_FULL_47_19]|uniref:Uncharacterized protein n=1 Tax=Candidatus Uhrbacteria bacterium RIFOXYC2_FULL_47_19 TaxID=1802424 RepID=A0A1F7WEF2_9BACT|nr:MAG: hypothetical protein A2480_02640 [Candidatus Uhrbacteria bacterium RIFOXYC2_FULL_47_19]HCC22247.1 hypothetical protein [Candidatus Uhrbacteria bacterium]